MPEKPDDELLHAQVWLERRPGEYTVRTELAHDPDDMLPGTDLFDFFAAQAVEALFLKDGTRFRISRSRNSMRDYLVRADRPWTQRPIRKGPFDV